MSVIGDYFEPQWLHTYVEIQALVNKTDHNPDKFWAIWDRPSKNYNFTLAFWSHIQYT